MRILIISHHIFPKQTPRAHRTTQLAIELAKRNYDVNVYAVLGNYNYEQFSKRNNLKINHIPLNWESTPNNSDNEISRSFIDKLKVKFFGKIFEYPNIEFLYKIPSIIKNNEKFDVLISIANPHQIHWGCSKAKKKFSKKFPKIWIADCGDPYMHNGKATRHYKIYSYFERKFCSLCNYITVPFEGAKVGYYKEFRDKIKVIPQGFNFEPLLKIKLSPINKVTTFIFSGNFFHGFREPTTFINYLSKIDKPFKFIIYTKNTSLLEEAKNLLKEKLFVKSTIERNQLIKELKKADFLINFENVNYPTSMPSKLIDYSISNRPILSLNPQRIDEEKVNEFLDGNYSKRFVLNDINQYHIKNVVDKFLELF